jgi:hypothetical protein
MPLKNCCAKNESLIQASDNELSARLFDVIKWEIIENSK